MPSDLPLDEVPEDVLREVLEEEKRIYRNRSYKKKPYPTSRDVMEAVREALRVSTRIHPDEFPDVVLHILESKGFEVRHVTVKRIWRAYETLVRKGVIRDELGVMM
ncbi:hypothetical protein [Pyrolobus fumarii]|nr:hypothetical protein [Pyrolobus fumarii]